MNKLSAVVHLQCLPASVKFLLKCGAPAVVAPDPGIAAAVALVPAAPREPMQLYKSQPLRDVSIQYVLHLAAAWVATAAAASTATQVMSMDTISATFVQPVAPVAAAAVIQQLIAMA
jgi:hypothetical protein